MSDPYLAEIILFAGNFAPRGWQFCNGQLISISSNSELFLLLGTIYGGDGRTTFALPDLRGRVAIGPGNGPGLTSKRIGEGGGLENHSLIVNEMPSHSHPQTASSSPPTQNTAENASLASGDITTPMDNIYVPENGNVPLSQTGNTGGGQSHNNVQPVIGLNYIICTQGTFPSRS